MTRLLGVVEVEIRVTTIYSLLRFRQRLLALSCGDCVITWTDQGSGFHFSTRERERGNDPSVNGHPLRSTHKVKVTAEEHSPLNYNRTDANNLCAAI